MIAFFFSLLSLYERAAFFIYLSPSKASLYVRFGFFFLNNSWEVADCTPIVSSLIKEIMLTVENLTYIHPDKTDLFVDLSFSAQPQQKIALIGHNGVGKSTLLRLIAGALKPHAGQVNAAATLYYIPQVFGQFNEITVAAALQIESKLRAYYAILDGDASNENLALLDDDWSLEERCMQALQYWDISEIDLFTNMSTLSGGQKTKVFLAGIQIHQPGLVLLDEPSNHLDSQAREQLYDFIKTCTQTLLVVSHDRTLLRLLDLVYELAQDGITAYGGNYDFYIEQKTSASQALDTAIRHREKELRKAKEKERMASERQQRMDARGKRKQEKAGVARIMMNTLRNNAEQSTSKLKDVHAEKISGIQQELITLRNNRSDSDKMRFYFQRAPLHAGKTLYELDGVQYRYGDRDLWPTALTFAVKSGERLAINGANGSGKTTLIRLLLGEIQPTSGTLWSAGHRAVYIDQDYALIDNGMRVYEQAQHANGAGLQEHEIKTRLAQFLFNNESWNKPCAVLSGGKRMRLSLCCLTLSNEAPDLIVLDEPTNNLDIQNLDILTKAVSGYQGTLLVVSHDFRFLEELGVTRVIDLKPYCKIDGA